MIHAPYLNERKPMVAWQREKDTTGTGLVILGAKTLIIVSLVALKTTSSIVSYYLTPLDW